MKGEKRRVIAFFLALILCTNLVPWSAFATEVEVASSDDEAVETMPAKTTSSDIFESSESSDVTRVAGGSRFSTCIAVANELKATLGIKRFDTVVIADGWNFPDALAGTYLAAVKNAPILLMDDDHISMMVDYIKGNLSDDGTIYILGSKYAVSLKAESALATVGYVKRLDGSSRYTTNLKILDELGTKTGELLVVYATAPWDALSVSSSGCPILLVNDKLRDDQKQYLATTNFDKITIIGSTDGVPKSMETELSEYCADIGRVYGKNRYMTSIEVAKYFYGIDRGCIVVACGTNFPDGLCSGVLAKAQNAPVVLADAGRESLANDYVLYYGVESGYVIGGKNVVSDETVQLIFGRTPVAPPTDSPDAYTVSFDSNGGSAVSIQTIKKGNVAVEPDIPIREGYVFAGWYLDSKLEYLYDFSTPVNRNLKLYAKWLSLEDTDGDGLVDFMENEYNSDTNNTDTDGDDLNDYIEVATGTAPTKKDTDGDGVSDADEDADGDGLTNIEEVRHGTLTNCDDTDSDGLTDEDEVKVYSTDPLIADTDGDGASDGAEVEFGSDPLIPESQFSVKKRVDADDTVVPSVEMLLGGDQVDTLNIAPIEDDTFFSENIPGFMGKAYDFSVSGHFSSATISFEFDPSVIVSDAEPCIYYFNEETQILEELDTFIEGSIAYAVVDHFSTYVLLNKVEFDKVWETEIKPPNTETGTEHKGLDIVFVIDYSQSMDGNDPKQLFKQVCKDFVEKLRDDVDRAAVVKFIKVAKLLSPLTKDKKALEEAIDSIVYDSGYGSNSGTNGSAGIHLALEQLSASESQYKYIVFITDGEDNRYSYSYDDLIASAVANNVNIYTVGMGSASEEILKKVAEGTSGKYYHATTSADADDVLNLDEVFKEIESETVDYKTDSNNDGISDYFTQLLCDGSLYMGTAKENPFVSANISFDEVQAIEGDYDGDGLLNGDELVVTYDEVAGRVYVSMKSDPTATDSDYDGYADNMDTNPLEWDISDRDLVMCAAMSYSYISRGTNLEKLSASLKSEINNRFIGTSGLVAGEVSELVGWKVVDTWYAMGGLEIIAFQKDKNIVVAYRGTEPDFLSDPLNFVQDWTNNGATYLFGLSTHSTSSKSFMLDIMRSYPGYNFYITGHSLGGHLTYNAAAAAINQNYDAVKGVVTFNGLGLCLGLTLIGDAWDEAQLLKKTEVIRDYMVDGDLVSRGLLGFTTFHYGKNMPYSIHEQADSAHSLFNFLVDIDPNRYLLK